MVLIALIILICIITFICAYKADWSKRDRHGAVIVALILCCIFILPVSIWAPLAGLEEIECVEEIELIPLQNLEQEGTWYVYDVNETFSHNGYYQYAYDNMSKYSLEGEAYEEDRKYKGETVKIYESAECTKPVLKQFEKRGKPGIFSFAVGYKEVETVFFVPTGTILKEE